MDNKKDKSKDGESQVQRCIRDFSHSRFDFIRSEIENHTT